MSYPQTRLRRLREHPALRRLIRENDLTASDLVMPYFVKASLKKKMSIPSMPGQFQHDIPGIVREAQECVRLGIPAILLFGIPHRKNAEGSSAYELKGVIPEAIRRIKKKCPNLIVMADVCLCEYTNHGHCGHLSGKKIINDSTLMALGKAAVCYARAGCDVVAPSDMMDGRVRVIREALDASGFEETPILSYAVKYKSAFYGPFRDAAENAPSVGDRSTYQMDAGNAAEALREVEEDLSEGADFVLVKPAMSYLDIVHRIQSRFSVPVGVFQVSGEYSMVKAASRNKWIDEKSVVMEMLLGMKRAGASFIISYWAKEVAGWLSEIKG